MECHISHVRLAAREIGRRAIGRLIQGIEAPQPPPQNDLFIAPEGIGEGNTLREDATKALYRKAEQYCRKHLLDDVTVDALAAEIGLSRRSLEMKLHEAGLPPPYHLLTELRLQKARHLLETTPMRMDEIAEACGFNAARALTNRFRARHGMSPGQWRREHK
jgi:transcriptional regulator GlxA family with amidase domain